MPAVGLTWLDAILLCRVTEIASASPLPNDDSIDQFRQASLAIDGWFRGEEVDEMIQVVLGLPHDCMMVEIGAFMGSASVLLAGIRKTCGSGCLHSVDPFDNSGDPLSVPIYHDLLSATGHTSLRACFDANMRQAGLNDWVVAHQGDAVSVAKTWNPPIDLLFLDGDQSVAGARLGYESWEPSLKIGGMIAIHNSADRQYAEEHDGSRRLCLAELHPHKFGEVRLVRATHFARKLA